MKVGALVALGHDAGRPEFLEELGPALEERGFESLWVPECDVARHRHRPNLRVRSFCCSGCVVGWVVAGGVEDEFS